MTLFWIWIVCAAGMTLAQSVFPGSAVYHTGWYNAANAAFFVLAATAKRRSALALFGCGVIVFAGVASGLMAPDTHTVVGAPGATVRDEDAGTTIVFPIDGTAIAVQRGSGTTYVGGGRRYSGGFIFWQQPRTVVTVNAADARGNHLTVTQPTNASFLSPVLLMQQTTAIAGMNVRFDSFTVPQAHRTVKAVLFSADQVQQLHSDPALGGGPAVLFDVADNADRGIPGGIAIVASGVERRVGDLTLGATVGTYPALVVASAPFWPALLIGLAVCAAGVFRSARSG